MQFVLHPPTGTKPWEHCWQDTATPFCSAARAMYARNGSGVYGSPGLSTGAFVYSPDAVPYPSGDPDIQITLHPWDKYARKWNDKQKELIGDTGVVISFKVSYNKAVSRGWTELNHIDPSNPLAPPHFEGPYLRNNTDAKPLIWAVHFLRNLTKSFGAPIQELVPGSDMVADQDIDTYIRCGLPQFRPAGLESCDPGLFRLLTLIYS